jgi:peptidoglycan biosynthesis protein MviN/MurJ (putative lipid II flippase)
MSDNVAIAVVIGLIVSVVSLIWVMIYLIGRQRGPDKPSWTAAVIGTVAGAGIATAAAIYITFNFLVDMSLVDNVVPGLLALLGILVFGGGLGGSMGALIGVLLEDHERLYKK